MALTVYRCEKCGQEFASIEDAEKCEESHLRIETATIRCYCMSGNLPYSIEVVFSNGDSRLYVIEGAQ